ncbi:MAG: Gfo/Idh/MocA family oxidoreductase [Trueperaceae bacterium]|nr:Gfo/Idh/MocA family oxidoreductase [Trueperaceae bacterium]
MKSPTHPAHVTLRHRERFALSPERSEPRERRTLGTHRPVRVGVIGAGAWGPHVARTFAEETTSALVVLADLDEERLALAQRRFPGVRITTDYSTLFDMTLDAVAIATPPDTHHAIAKACLQQGLHCLVEKPLAMSVADARDLIDTAHAHGRKLMAGHTFEYDPAVLEVRRMVQERELGEVFYLDAVRTEIGRYQLGSDALWDLAPNDVSIANFVFDGTPERVTALAGSFSGRDRTVNDLVYLHLEYPGNRLANIRVSTLDPKETRTTTVVGDEKMVVYDDVSHLEKVRVYDRGARTGAPRDPRERSPASDRYGAISIPYLPPEEPLRVATRHFAECVAGNIEPRTDGLCGLRVVEVLEAAERSLASGGPVEIGVRASARS